MTDFKEGDIVQLKSGGQQMTVNFVESTMYNYVNVVWFTDGKLNEAELKPGTLVKVESN